MRRVWNEGSPAIPALPHGKLFGHKRHVRAMMLVVKPKEMPAAPLSIGGWSRVPRQRSIEISFEKFGGGAAFDPCKHRRHDRGLGRTGAGVSTQAARDYLRKGVFEVIAPGRYTGQDLSFTALVGPCAFGAAGL